MTWTQPPWIQPPLSDEGGKGGTGGTGGTGAKGAKGAKGTKRSGRMPRVPDVVVLHSGLHDMLAANFSLDRCVRTLCDLNWLFGPLLLL